MVTYARAPREHNGYEFWRLKRIPPLEEQQEAKARTQAQTEVENK